MEIDSEVETIAAAVSQSPHRTIDDDRKYWGSEQEVRYLLWLPVSERSHVPDVSGQVWGCSPILSLHKAVREWDSICAPWSRKSWDT